VTDTPQSLAMPGPKGKDTRADKHLANHPEITSRTRAAKLIEQGAVCYSDGRPIKKPSEKLEPETEIHILLPKPQQTDELHPLDLELDFLYEDDDLLVVNKPAGLVVHPAAGHAQDTLVNALVAAVPNLSMGFGERRPGIVHRLDKDTSGLLVVAKNDKTQIGLVSQFKNKSVHRVYNAVVFGTPTSTCGACKSYLIRHPKDRKRFCSEKLHEESKPKGKYAVTHYKLLKEYSCGLSLVECRLETGRTHQIRVHMSELGHALIGDRIYGSEKRAKNLKSSKLRGLIAKLERVGLHAMELGFLHPTTGEQLMFRQDWPTDMQSIFEFCIRK
jgi:23S rRNA pseudouridine1911/1915/1917 synthase